MSRDCDPRWATGMSRRRSRATCSSRAPALSTLRSSSRWSTRQRSRLRPRRWRCSTRPSACGAVLRSESSRPSGGPDPPQSASRSCDWSRPRSASRPNWRSDSTSGRSPTSRRSWSASPCGNGSSASSCGHSPRPVARRRRCGPLRRTARSSARKPVSSRRPPWSPSNARSSVPGRVRAPSSCPSAATCSARPSGQVHSDRSTAPFNQASAARSR